MAPDLSVESPGTRAPALAVVESDARARARLTGSLDTEPDAVVTSTSELDEHPALAGPTIVIFGPSFSTDHGLACVQDFTRSRSDAGAILVVRRVATKVLKAALRAGVRDVLVEPLDRAELAEAIASIGQSLPAGVVTSELPAEPGRLVTVFSPKGGAGSSVVASNLAVTLARRAANPVALVDVDLQFGDVAVMFNVSPRHTIVDAVAPATAGDPDVLRRLVVRHEPSGVLVLPAPVDPAAGDAITTADITAVIDTLRAMCSYVIVDTPTSFNDAVLSLIEASDEIVMVGTDDVPSVKNVKVGIQALRMLNIPDQRVSLVLNRVEGRSRVQGSEIERALQFPIAATIPADRAVTNSVNAGNPVVLDAPKSAAARVLTELGGHVAAKTARRLAAADAGRSS